MPMVLLDWRMPNLTGLEVLRCLRHAADKAPRLVARFINFLAGIIKRGGPKASYS
jgi:CheY-like chemotaxis protein